jgi:hypothetical protein
MLKGLMNFLKNQLIKTQLIILTQDFLSINQDELSGYPEPIFSGLGIFKSNLHAYHKTSKKAFNVKSSTKDRKLEKSIKKLHQLLVQSDRQSNLIIEIRTEKRNE